MKCSLGQLSNAATIGVLVCSLLSSAYAKADDASSDAKPTAGYRHALFNGQDMSGWKVTGCEAAVEDGMLVLQSGNGLVRTDQRYDDFELELSWKARDKDKWDSGIFFRCELPPKGRPWPRRYQANLLKGKEGDVGGVEGATSRGLVRPGEWNHFKLRVVGKTASLKINGQDAWEADGLEAASGYIALQAEVPGGGQFEFKDIVITELHHRPLFNGKDLRGWEGAGRDAALCWEVEDGLLVCNGKKGPWLRTAEQFGDFNLRMEYRLREGGNSGVYVRVPKGGDHHGKGAGVEVQILDDNAERYAKLKPYQYCGSVYKIVPASPRVSLPAGQWNTFEIECRGARYRIVHNGVVVVDADVQEAPELAERRAEGFLGLQNHSERVWFRHVRIGPASPDTAP